jgi:hypothetical protein
MKTPVVADCWGAATNRAPLRTRAVPVFSKCSSAPRVRVAAVMLMVPAFLSVSASSGRNPESSAPGAIERVAVEESVPAAT